MATHEEIIARIYVPLNMGAYSDNMLPKLIQYALQNNWMGRHIVVLGSGTGRGLAWIARHGYILTAVEKSPEMLALAQSNVETSRSNINWQRQDLLDLSNIRNMDLVLAIDVFAEVDGLKMLEHAFERIFGTLREGRLLIFDLPTIEGLVTQHYEGDRLALDSDNLTVFVRNQYDFERNVLSQRFLIMAHDANDTWHRHEVQRTLRAYPIQAVVALLRRKGFQVSALLTPDMKPYEPGAAGIGRVVFVAHTEPTTAT